MIPEPDYSTPPSDTEILQGQINAQSQVIRTLVATLATALYGEAARDNVRIMFDQLIDAVYHPNRMPTDPSEARTWQVMEDTLRGLQENIALRLSPR